MAQPKRSRPPSEAAKARARRREVALELRDARRQRASVRARARSACASSRAELRREVEQLRARVASACATPAELAAVSRRVLQLREALAGVPDPSAPARRRAQERREEALEQEAGNLPPAWRRAFLRHARAGKIRDTRGRPVRPGARWERFGEMVEEDPDLLLASRAEPSDRELERAQYEAAGVAPPSADERRLLRKLAKLEAAVEALRARLFGADQPF